MIPPNGASMADAARTRENEGVCICDGCNFTDTCSHEAEAVCKRYSEEDVADWAVKARKERDL